MAERQEHGFTFENYIKSLYEIQNYSNSYTSQWDGILNNYPVSIKLEKISTTGHSSTYKNLGVF